MQQQEPGEASPAAPGPEAADDMDGQSPGMDEVEAQQQQMMDDGAMQQ